MLLPRPPATSSLDDRVRLTTSCRDCDAIAKVRGAGSIVERDGTKVQIMHNGVLVVEGCYYGDWMTRIITDLGGHHEPQEELVFHHILKHIPAEATMIELGGYWSYYSLWFLHAARGRRWPRLWGDRTRRRAIVLEPDPAHLSIGHSNAKLNGLAPEFVHGCVGGRPLSDLSFATEKSGTIRLRQYSVPELMHEAEIEYLDILHCDIQGAEVEVIESLAPILQQRRIRFLVVSTHAHHISGNPLTHQLCLAMLKSAGAQILEEHDVHESYSGDGLIACHFGREPLDWPRLRMSRARYCEALFRNPIYDLAELQGKN